MEEGLDDRAGDLEPAAVVFGRKGPARASATMRRKPSSNGCPGLRLSRAATIRPVCPWSAQTLQLWW